MHNPYITSKCILDIDDKLKLIDYKLIDITDISPMLKTITLNIMDQCYQHTEDFHNNNKMSKKRYSKLSPLVIEQMKDMLFVKKKFIEYFAKPGPKNKSDLLTYVFGFQMSEIQYDEYIFKILCAFLRDTFSSNFFDKHKLSYFELNSTWPIDHIILRSKPKELNLGEIDFNTDEAVLNMNMYLNQNGYIDKEAALDLANKINDLLLKDYKDLEYQKLDKPFHAAMTELIKHIKVFDEMDKVSPHVKRI